jgi:hypothetical protein
MQTKVKIITKDKHLIVSLGFDHERFQLNVLKEDPTTHDLILICGHWHAHIMLNICMEQVDKTVKKGDDINKVILRVIHTLNYSLHQEWICSQP